MRLLAILALALSLGCAAPQPQVHPARPAYLDAVRPMQVKVVETGMSDMVTQFLKSMESKFETGSYENICTMTAIRHDGVYLTAAHCVAAVGAEGRYVDEQPLTVVFANFVTDVALVKAEHVVPKAVLEVSFEDVTFEQEVTIAGHPFGYKDLFVTKGWVSNPRATNIGPVPFMLFNCTVAPGNSGSAVLNADGQIISILQIGWGRTFSPVSGGITTDNFEAIKPFLPNAL